MRTTIIVVPYFLLIGGETKRKFFKRRHEEPEVWLIIQQKISKLIKIAYKAAKISQIT